MIVNRDTRQAATTMPDLQTRQVTLQREMVDQLERSIALENHWLIYTLLGWEHLATCAVSHYLVQVAQLQYPHRWTYLVLWFLQIAVALATIKVIRGRPRIPESPLKPLVNRVWCMFLFLCCNVAVLNVVAGLPVFVFLPVLATLSCFAFSVLAGILSRKLGLAGLVMFVAGLLIARFPDHGFLLYGGSWLLVLQVLGVVFYRRRTLWLTAQTRPARPAEPAFSLPESSLCK